MRLLWDWRLARIVSNDEVIDEAIWDGTRGPGAVAERLRLVGVGRMTPEARDLQQRFPEAERAGDGSSDSVAGSSWPPIDDDEAALLDSAAAILAQSAVADAAGDLDRRLEHLVDAVGEMRSAWTTLEARIVEWAGLFLAELDLDGSRSSIPTAIAESESIVDLAESLDIAIPEHLPLDPEWISMRDGARTVCELQARIDAAERAIRAHAEGHLPSLSALLGPMLAARLSVAAHGRKRLARLPSSTVQVLGAEKAFFAHLRQGSPVPKHGMIFQHPWISRSPRWVRGKVARLLAGKASIAARVDHFGGAPWGVEEISAVESAVSGIRSRHPKPTGRRGR